MDKKLEVLRNEYELKRDVINSRLSDFKRFREEPVEWHWENDSLILKPADKTINESLFEELCFCIFTANTSAVMGIKAVQNARNELHSGSFEELSTALQGYRYPNIRAKHVIHTRNKLEENHDFDLLNLFEKFENPKELREFIAGSKDVKGLGMKEASHYLRNVGFENLAIIDKHIVNSLHEFGYVEKPERPRNKKEYLEYEEKMKKFAEDLGVKMDELDVLLWARKNGEVLK